MLATYVPALLFYALILLFVMLVTPQVDDLILQVIANLAVLGATLLLMWLLFHGVANRHNANRNSSAVIAAVDFMRTLDREQKRRIGFVFVDRCDRRCPGAELLASYLRNRRRIRTSSGSTVSGTGIRSASAIAPTANVWPLH